MQPAPSPKLLHLPETHLRLLPTAARTWMNGTSSYSVGHARACSSMLAMVSCSTWGVTPTSACAYTWGAGLHALSAQHFV